MEEEGRYSCVGQTRLDTATSRAAWLTVDGEEVFAATTRISRTSFNPQRGLTVPLETGNPGPPAPSLVGVEGGSLSCEPILSSGGIVSVL